MIDQVAAESIKVPKLSKAVLIGVVFFVIDALWLNEGVIAASFGIYVLFIGLPLAFRKKNISIRPQRIRNFGIYFIAIVAIFLMNSLNNRIAAERAELVISAVKKYNQKLKKYPATLNDLVPEYISEIPSAKFTLSMNEFFYRVGDGNATLLYVKYPPFGRPYFNFNENKWSFMD